MKSRLSVSVCIAFLGAILTFAVATGQTPQVAVHFEQIEEVVSGFQEAQHLYTQGEVGVSADQLAALEAWLDQNGPHWTVVLMQRSMNQSYSAPDGRAFSGMDAVEFALGHGLANRTSFGRLEHPKTGETDGAVFVLFLEDRKFSYYASDAQDRRGIGEAQWIGNLDRNARVAMQNGGRIIDAVKDTVNDINQRLAQGIAAEEQAERERIAQEERIKRERQRAVAQVQQELKETRSKLIVDVEGLAAEFSKNFPEANASIMARPPVSEWNAQLDKAESGLNEDNSREISQAVSQTVANIHRQLDYYGAHTAFEQSVAPLQQRWQGLTLHRFAATAEAHATSAQKLLRQSRGEHLSGNPAFIDTLNLVRKELDLADRAIYAASAKLEQDLARWRVIRRTILTTLSIAFVMVAALLLYLHRRRRPALAMAQRRLASTQQQFQQEQSLIDAIHLRKKSLVGSLDTFAKRGKTGETLQLAQRIETDCNSIDAMTNAARLVFSKVEALMRPSGFMAKIINLFSSTRFLESRNLLGGRSFEIVDKGSSDAEAIARLSQPLTFEDFLGAVVSKRNFIAQNLNQLERCSRDVVPALEAFEQKYSSLLELCQSLKAEASNDRYFSLSNLESELLPSVRRLVDRGRKMAEIDPVHVLLTICPEAIRQVDEASDAGMFVNQVRAQQFPVFDQTGDQLQALGHRVQWIEEHVVAMGERLNQLMLDACCQETKEILKQVDVDARSFLTKLRGIVEVADITLRERLSDVQTAREGLAEARAKVAAALSIERSEAIAEESLNPDDHLRSAETAIKASRVAIDMGNLDDAVRTATAAQDETRYALSLVDDSLESLNEFSVQYSQSQEALIGVTESLASVTQTVSTAEQTYAPNALIWHDEPDNESPSGESHEDEEEAWEPVAFASGEPVSLQVESAQRIIESIRLELDTASSKYASGKLLETANILRFAAEGISESNKRLDLARNHCKRLDAMVPANIRRAETLMGELTKLDSNVDDSRAEKSTQQSHEQIKADLQQLASELRTSRVDRDPFEDAKELLQRRIAIVAHRAQIKADFAAFEEAKLAVEGSRRELKAVARLAMQSIEDQLPDSAEITRCQDEIRRLSPIVSAAEVELKVAHNDWQAIQKTASDATAELGVISGSLGHELRSAQEAALGIKTASSEVLRAKRWTGAYGISISGNAGSVELEEARAALARGDYAGTLSLSSEAIQSAGAAIDAAEEAVASRRRQEEVAAARRRAREQSLLSASSGSSFGSSRSSWSSSSSSRSSFSSSSSSRSSGGSSGFSRSGW